MRLWRGQVKSGESPKQNLQKNMCPVRSWAVTTFCCWNSMAISRFGRVHPVLTDCNPGFGRCLLVYDKELPPRHMLLIFIHVASNPFLTLFTPSPPPNFSKCWMFVHAIPFTPQKKKNTTRTPSVTVLQRDRDRSCVSACWIPTFSPPPEARMIQDDEQTLDSGSDIFQRYTGIWTKTHMWENLENSL